MEIKKYSYLEQLKIRKDNLKTGIRYPIQEENNARTTCFK